jgi:Na+/melibiose symporter-like transporter
MNTRRRRQRLLIAAMLVDTLGGGLLAPFELIYALKVARLPLTTAGVILSVASAAGIALGPVAGAAVDRFGPTRVVALANALGVAGCASLLLWRGGWGYALGAFFLGAYMRVFWASFTPLVASVARADELEQWFGRLRGARYIGIVSGEALSGAVLLAGVETGLRLLVAANGLSFVAALVLVLAAGPARVSSIGGEGEATAGHGGYRQVLRDGINVALAGLNVAATLLLTAPIMMLPVFVLERLHLPTWLPGILAAVLTATAAAGLLFGARLVRGRRRLRNLEIAAVLWTLGCVAFLFASVEVALVYVALVVGVILLGIGEAMYAPTADALPAALAPAQLRGRYAAVHQMAWGISEAIAPTLGAATLAADSAVLWLTLGGIAAGTAVTYRGLERPSHGRDGIAGAELTAEASGPRCSSHEGC